MVLKGHSPNSVRAVGLAPGDGVFVGRVPPYYRTTHGKREDHIYKKDCVANQEPAKHIATILPIPGFMAHLQMEIDKRRLGLMGKA